MSILHSLSARTLSLSVPLAFAIIVSGCNAGGHPDEQSAVYQKLNQGGLMSVIVSQDRTAGTMTLTGIVSDPNSKTKAEELAKEAAPGYTISDQIQVEAAGLSGAGASTPAPSPKDAALESSFKAKLESQHGLQREHIECTAKNGTLILKGSVKTAAQKREAENLAKKLPDVQNVVNDIEVLRKGEPESKS